MSQRSGELAQRLAAVTAAIERACLAVGRDPGSVRLIVVSKTWPVADLEVLVDLGVRDFGENRAEELTQKAEHFAGRALRWHFLGQIQSKKAAGIARVAHVVHSLDRSKLVPGLARGAVDAGRVLEAFLQVSLAELAPQDDASGRGGAAPQEWPVLAAAVAEQPSLRLAGVMALPPLHADPQAAFARLAEISARLRADHPGATGISAGMSHDFPAAIAAGATHVRIGSAVFGERKTVR